MPKILVVIRIALRER